MVIGAARDHAVATLCEALGEGPGVAHDLALVGPEGRMKGLAEADGLGGDDVHERAALDAREDGLVDDVGVFFLREDEAAARPAHRLVRGAGDEVGRSDGVGVETCGNEAGDMSDVAHEVGPDLAGDLGELGEVDLAGIGGAAGDDHFGFMLAGELPHVVVVDALGLARDAVGKEAVEHPGEIELVAVGEVPAVRQAHAEEGVAGLEHGEVDGHVGAGAAVGLDVGVLGAEDHPGTLDGEPLADVDPLAPAVVALAGIAFGVLVGEDGALGFEGGLADVVFGGNEDEVVLLAQGVAVDGLEDFGVREAERFRVHPDSPILRRSCRCGCGGTPGRNGRCVRRGRR